MAQKGSRGKVTARSVQVDGHSLEMQLELPEEQPSLYAKLWLYVRESGKLSQMSGAAAKVYMALLTRADFTSLECFPGNKLIARDTGLSLPAIRGAIAQLIDLELVVRTRKYNRQQHLSNEYVIVKPPQGKKVSLPQKDTSPARKRKQPSPGQQSDSQLDSLNENQLTTTEQQIFTAFIESKKTRANHAKRDPAGLLDWVRAMLQEYEGKDIIAAIRGNPDRVRQTRWADHWEGVGAVLEQDYKSRVQQAVGRRKTCERKLAKTQENLAGYQQAAEKGRKHSGKVLPTLSQRIEHYEAEVVAIQAELAELEQVIADAAEL